ncbi:glycosyltransferase family 2 protein [Dyella sp.]|jgi:glycosyltransferase involved in cell wall biosynthesis|uniref:glycosyltransferase family 2 protein n=1 Tax=Dyella sp. TaxID=1869338 RepID=UPI002D79F748|nr:glycosyltransferase family 2 protein [Dyella sp.]HET6432965.1 glycosyltransferase family 2 protein [Dyella sp.]
MSLVSVIVPTFNRAYCLPRTLDSALAQTHGELEVLVVDDGSTDDTRQLIATRYADDPRVRYLYQENRGVAAARNLGLAQARGDFVALLDSDDIWQPWKLELQLRCLQQFPELGMVWTDMEAIDPSGKVFSAAYIRTMYSAYALFAKGQLFTQTAPLREVAPDLLGVVGDAQLRMGMIFSQMIMGSLVHTSTVLLRRQRLEQVKAFDETLRFSGEDYDFHLRTCRYGPVGFIDLPAIQYQRGMPDRLTRDEYRIHTATNFLRTISPFIEGARDEIHLPRTMVDSALADAHLWIAELRFEAGEIPAARHHLWLSVRHRRGQGRAWMLWLACFLPSRLRSWLKHRYQAIKLPLRRRHGHP